MSHEHQARLQAYNPLTWPAGAVDTPCIPSPQRGVVRTLRGTVALAVTASEQRSCRHENPLLSPCSHPAICLRRLPLPARGDRAGGPLVPALQPVVPRCRKRCEGVEDDWVELPGQGSLHASQDLLSAVAHGGA